MKHLIKKSKILYLFEADEVNMNSPKETQLKAHEALVSEYNSKKNSLNSITDKDRESWEDEAKKIINGNKYLAMYWKIAKIEKYITRRKVRNPNTNSG